MLMLLNPAASKVNLSQCCLFFTLVLAAVNDIEVFVKMGDGWLGYTLTATFYGECKAS